MILEYGSCYKNVKEAAYKSVSTAMRRYASEMEDSCSYLLYRLNRCVDCDTETFDSMYRRLHEYKMYRLLGNISFYKEDMEKSIYYFNKCLDAATKSFRRYGIAIRIGRYVRRLK